MRRPEHGSAEAEEGAGEDEEAGIAVVVVGENGADVEEVAEAANAEGQAQADAVGDAASEEADAGEDRIEGGVGVVDVVGAD